MTKKTTYSLFNPSGCLTYEAMKAFREKKLPESDTVRIEKHLNICDLCRDAMEGLALVADPQKLDVMVNEINEYLRRKPEHNQKPDSKSSTTKRIGFYLAAAASVVILFGLLYWLNENRYSGKLNQPLADVINLQEYQSVPDKPYPEYGAQSASSFEDMEDEEMEMESEDQGNKNFQNEDRVLERTTFNTPKIENVPGLSLLKRKESSVSSAYKKLHSEKKTEPDNIVLASVQPLEYYIGEVIVHSENHFQENDREDGLALAETLTSKSSTHKPVIARNSTQATVDSVQSGSHFFSVVEKMPEFPGGRQALNQYFRQQLEYPDQARQEGLHGTVYLSFVIQPDGKVSNVKVLQGIGGGCDREAVSAVESMPDWIPASQHNQNVPVLITFPVTFELR